MDLELHESVVLVTGGTDGLGRALSHALIEEGARVALCGRDEQRLQDTEDELTAAGGNVLAYRCDVTDPTQLAGFVDATIEKFGRLDGVVNNAGQVAAKKVVETTDEDWTQDLDLKLMAAIRLVRLTEPFLKASDHGAIVNVLAISGKSPGASSSPTSVSRAAGLALTKALSKELGPDGIRVNAVLIGLIASGQWRRLAESSGITTDALYEVLLQNYDIPLGRLGQEREFADLVSFLLSPRSSYITGTAINCDGGLSPAS